MTRINIEAELIECAVPIEAARGDRLVVLHGVVVGVDRAAPTIQVTPPPVNSTPLPWLNNAIPPYLRAAMPIADGVIEIMRKMNRPMTAKEIGSRWPRNQGEGPPRLSDAFALLRQRGLIEKIAPPDGKKERFPPYRLVDQAAPSPAQATMADDLQPPWAEEPS